MQNLQPKPKACKMNRGTMMGGLISALVEMFNCLIKRQLTKPIGGLKISYIFWFNSRHCLKPKI
jgi:hypothetical protein